MPKLKVFRTTSGFHDSYVAAASRAAALRAWGAHTDLFAMGAAKQVTDARLMSEPLAKPGAVVKRSRGSAGEHLSAAGRSTGRDAADAKPARARKAKPPPGRARLDEADQRLAEAETRFELARAELEKQIRLLEEKRRKLQRLQENEIGKLRLKRDRAEKGYRSAIRARQTSSA